MSSVSKTSGTANSSITVSSKSWFLTYNANESDVFVWKDGVQMKFKNSDSAGSVVGTYSGKRISLLYNNTIIMLHTYFRYY